MLSNQAAPGVWDICRYAGIYQKCQEELLRKITALFVSTSGYPPPRRRRLMNQ